MCDIFNLHKYRDIFGPPRSGIHATRIPYLDVALSDTISTIVVAVLIAYIFGLSIWKTVLAAFALGLLAHVLFGVRTKLTVALGLV